MTLVHFRVGQLNIGDSQVLNDRQRKNLWLGVIALLVIGICPPWKEFGRQERPLGFAPIYSPPTPAADASRVDVDFSRLGIEMLLACVVTGALLASAGGRPEGPSFIAPTAKSAERPAAPVHNANVIRVELPREYYLGELFVESAEDPEYWDELCPARGAFDIPKGKKIQLELAKDLRVDLSFLSVFPAGVIYSIDGSDCKVSDDDLAKLSSLGGLRELDLSGTAVSSTGVASLKGLTSLEKLWLDRSLVDDQCVPSLIALNRLKKLSLAETRIGELAAESLKKDLANCELVLS
jgi:hypothetical protein